MADKKTEKFKVPVTEAQTETDFRVAMQDQYHGKKRVNEYEYSKPRKNKKGTHWVTDVTYVPVPESDDD
jgi:hypothetical protein